MTRHCYSLSQVRQLLSDYVTEERPLNLTEMREALSVIESVYMPVKRISEAPDDKRNSWLLANDWMKIRQFIG